MLHLPEEMKLAVFNAWVSCQELDKCLVTRRSPVCHHTGTFLWFLQKQNSRIKYNRNVWCSLVMSLKSQYTTASSVCPRGQFWNGQNIGERKVKEENKLKGALEKRSLTSSYWNNLGKKKSESVWDPGIEPWDLCGDLKTQVIAIAGKGGASSQSTWGLNWTVGFLAHSLPWVYKCYTLSSRALQN